MKITRSTKCSLKFATVKKRTELQSVLSEYGKTVNCFIEYFWKTGEISKGELLKQIVDIPDTWLSARLRKVAAREALDMVKSVQEVLDSNKQQLQLSINSIECKYEFMANAEYNLLFVVIRERGKKVVKTCWPLNSSQFNCRKQYKKKDDHKRYTPRSKKKRRVLNELEAIEEYAEGDLHGNL